MAKNFRGGRKGQKQGTGQGPKPNAKQDSRQSRGSDESRGSGPTKSRSHGKTKKDIRNARSLSEVLGMGGRKNRVAGPTPERPVSTRRDNQEPEQAAKKPSTVSKMLTYIMNFQPPGGGQTETRETRAQTPPPSRRPEPKPALREETNFRWPRERASGTYNQKGAEDRRGHRSGKPADHSVQGIVKRHPDGYGFLVADDSSHPDVYISRQSMLGVMTNDRVEVQVFKPKRGSNDDRLSGEISRVLSRANKSIVGKFLPVDQKYGVILDEGRGWGADLRIATKDSMGAQEGQVVAAEVIEYPGPDNEFTGRVIGIIGDLDNPINDVIRVVHQQGIPSEFSALAIGEARKFGGKVTESEMKGREDLTQVPLITIDGATARDFDDAIFVEETDGGFHLIVAIADVSHYVKPGTPLDQEAYERGTSTYFPNFVVPMLPEELSNELCSLNPHVNRLCFACDMRINFNGEVESYRFFEAVMESKARVTYGEAQEVIDAHATGTPIQRVGALQKFRHVEENILRAADLAKILMAKRFREGSLDLEIPETQVVVDSTGESIDVIKSERLFAHRLIEELMLVTNICTARFMEERGIPGIYRVHEEPDPDNLQALQRYLWNFGGSKSVVGSNLQKKLSKALQSMEGRPEAQILNILTLRTMKQAHYSQDNVGHFGLGFSQYSHFTSPIRRYPDLIAHRLIKSQIYPRYKSMAMNEEELASATNFLSACEQRSTKAERKVVSIKKARFMRKHVGEEYEGIVSSVAKFGVFVLLRQFDVDGLVKIEKLGNDRFMFDDQNLRLIGTRTGRRYTIGDSIRVVVTGADPEQGKIDFELPADLLARQDDGDQDEEDDFETRSPREPKRGAFKGGRSKKGPRKDQGKQKAGSKKRSDVSERGKAENNRRRVRKERVSKRRGKN